jgi:hypothetical protein
MMADSIELEDGVTRQRDDMKLVPRKPAPEMIRAAWADAHDKDSVGVWSSMIAEWESATATGTR